VSPSSSRRNRVVVIAVVLGCLLVAAVADRSGSSTSTSPDQLVALGPRVPTAQATDTAWYCAEGTSNPGGRADERIYVANVDSRPARARVTVMQGSDQPPAVKTLEVGPDSLASVRVGDILAVADPGVLVEVTGGRAVVTHSITGTGDSGYGPCSRDASSQWHFAAGTTVKGATLDLALFNPFSEDAIVNIDFLTDTGPLAPDSLQGFVVPAHGRVTVPVQDQARRHALVATEVEARRGRVVAEQSLVLDGTDGRKGLGLSLGAPEVARPWEFANASVTAGRTQTMVIANPATVPTTALVRTRLDGGVLEPETVNLPAQTAVAVDLGRRVSPGAGFSVAVESRLPVIAESLVAVQAPIPSVQRGLALTIGASRWATRWVDAPARAASNSLDSTTVLNPGSTPVTFRMSVLAGGRRSVPPTTARVQLAPGKRAVIDIARLGLTPDASVVIDATGPVVVERASSGMPGITVAEAVPDLDR
jgi:hypothetical protein